MDQIETLEQEHEQIERELLELEEIFESEEVNYGNLVHVFKKLHGLWNEHEEKEEKFFSILEKDQIKVHVKKMLFEHKVLRLYKEAMLKAINSGSELEMKKALNENAVVIIKKLREHIIDENESLCRITL